MISKRTQEFLLSQSIAQETSAPLTPEQNGFIERENRTVMESVRSMLFHRKMPEKLWGEAANTAVYLLNRSINKNTGNQTPYELYFGEKPRVTHIKIFGSLAMMKLQEKKRSGYQKKLDPRAKQTLLVGYERDYTYRVYDPESNKIIKTREISVDETKTLKLVETGPTYEHIDVIVNTGSQQRDDEGHDASSEVSSLDETSQEFSTPTRAAPSNQQLLQASGSPQISGSAQEAPQAREGPQTVSQPMARIGTRRAQPQEPIYENSYNLRSRNREGQCAEAYIVYGDEPCTFEDAINATDYKEWKAAMDEEYSSLVKMNTWTLVDRPKGRQPVKCKWVYKIKRN